MKIIYSILGVLMLSFIVVSCSDNTTDPVAPTPYELASASMGGIMYDNFFSTEAGFDTLNPNYANFKAHADFFRCKQCHAWDRLGREGSYISRAPKTSRPNIAPVNLFLALQADDPQEIFDDIKNSVGRRDLAFDLTTYDPTTNFTEGDKMPNYSQVLTDTQIWDLVKFLKEGAIDVTQLYDYTTSGSYPTGTITYSNIGKDGNATNGKTFFATECAGCHGTDGKTLELEGMSVGQFLRNKPNEVQQKVKFGALGTAMPGHFDITVAQMKDLYKALTDTTAFPDL